MWAQTAEYQEEQEQAFPAQPAAVPLVDESSIILGETIVSQTPASPTSVFVVIRMVLVLALAALAIYGVLFLVRRITRPKESHDPHLKVLAKVPIGGEAFTAILSVGARAWLVAGGSSTVNLISEIDDPEVIETMLLSDSAKTAEQRPYFSFLSLLKRQPSSHDENSVLFGVSNLRKQRERLKGL